MVARSLFLQAGGAEAQLGNINADPQIVWFSAVVLYSLVWTALT